MLLVIEAIAFRTEAQTVCAKLARNLDARGQIVYHKIALAPLAPQSPPIDEPRLVGRETLQRSGAPGDATVQRPAAAEIGEAGQLMPAIPETRRAIAGFAVETRCRQRVRVAIHRRNAAIEGRVEMGNLAYIGDPRPRRRFPRQRRRHDAPLQRHMIAPAVAILGRDDDASGDPIGQRPGKVEFDPARIERAIGEDRARRWRKARRLRHDIDAARRIDVAEQRAGRALERLDALGCRRVARRSHPAIGYKAINIIFGAAVGGAQESADRKIIEESAAIILIADPADQFKRIGQA